MIVFRKGLNLERENARMRAQVDYWRTRYEALLAIVKENKNGKTKNENIN